MPGECFPHRSGSFFTDINAMNVTPQQAPCGAAVTGVDLAKPLTTQQVAAIRDAWLQHQVLVFPDQHLQLDDLEHFAATIGPFGNDPYFDSVPGHPPQATVLYGNVIPPIGGDTLFANQYLAWEALPAELKVRLQDLLGMHSARNGYSRQGLYGEDDEGRSMAIKFSDTALAVELHPIARVHPETGRTALFISPGYTIGIDGMDETEAWDLLAMLFKHQPQPEFVYRHQWSPNMLVMWDNRCVTHAATGGYEGHARLLHRITVASVATSQA